MFNIRLTFSEAFDESLQIERIGQSFRSARLHMEIDTSSTCSKKRIKKEPQWRLSGV
jgi:hypothetical protein